MPDEMNTPQAGDTTAAETDVKPEAEPKVFDEKYVKELRAEAAQHRKQARDLQAQFEALKAQVDDRTTKQLEEEKQWQTLAEKRASEISALKAQLAEAQLSSLRASIGSELKLPSALVKRLQGTTEDEIRADAEALAKELGLDKPAAPPAAEPAAPAAPAQPTQKTAVAPAGNPVGETVEQRRDRLYGRKPQDSALFKPNG